MAENKNNSDVGKKPDTEAWVLDEAAVRTTTRALLDDLASNLHNSTALHGSVFDRADQLEKTLLAHISLHDQNQFLNERIIPWAFSSVIKIFFSELVHYVRALRATQGEAAVEKFSALLYEAWFSVSPNIFNLLRLSAMLGTVAHLTRVPELQGYLGQNVVGEMTYELAFAHEDVWENILAEFENSSVAHQLEMIHIFETIGADAVANGEWAEPAYQHMITLTNEIQNHSPYPFVRWAAEHAHARLQNEYKEPSMSVFRRLGDRRYGRIEHDDNSLHRGEKTVPVAQDAVGVYDHSGVLQHIGRGAQGGDVSVKDGEAFVADPSVLPFGEGQAGVDDWFLFQQMHRPVMRAAMQEIFKIEITDLSLRNEFQLLKFISG